MATASIDDLVVTALSALASAPGGMTLPDFSTHLETRLGPTDEAALDSKSPQSRQFQSTVQDLISGPDGLVARGYATLDGSGGLIGITEAGRKFIGR